MEKKNDSLQNKLTLTIDHNPYEITIFASENRRKGKLIIFPLFNYQAEQQYRDLLNPMIEQGYRIMTISLLEKGDKVLSLGYYYKILEQLLEMLYVRNLLPNKEELILMGFGIGANLASHLQLYHTDSFSFSKMILVSPVNRYKDEYKISNEIANFEIPTYIFYGQFDSVNPINERFAIFQAGRDNPNVSFTSYPAVGHYLYYKNTTSLELERLYRHSDFDMLLGEDNVAKVSFLPSEKNMNDKFFEHLFDVLEDRPFKKRIALLTDGNPLFINGVEMVVELLRRELENLGYETYIVALWKKNVDFALLPTEFHIPIISTYAKFIKNHKELMILKTFTFKSNARMLAMFGFDYLHLHTEYSMSKIAIELSKITGIRMPYTYHTLWKLYYENKFGRLVGDFAYSAVKMIMINKVYKECPVVIVPSKKSYEILRADSKKPKDIRIIPSAINKNRFIPEEGDEAKVEALREKYNLKGKKVLGYVGRVSTEKNIIETIDFLSRVKYVYPNVVFMIVGVGDALEDLQKATKKEGLEDNVIYVGQVLNTELKLYYPLFDAFVTASNFETQGLTYFEAATIGTPILAKKDKAIEGVFEDGKNAYIYSSFEEWQERLNIILNSDNKKIIEAAKQTMKEFSQEQWAKKMLSIYQELNDK